MENASKALIMAGSILIAIIIISLGIVVFRKMAKPIEEGSSLTEQQIATFNSKLTPYFGESVSGSQVNVLVQLVRTINTKAKNENDTASIIRINGSDNPQRVDTGNFYKVHGIANSNGLFTTISIE